MRHLARALGLALCLLVLLTTCSAPRGRGPGVAAFVTDPTMVLGPTTQPTVTPVPGAPPPTPAPGAPAAPPLAAVAVPVDPLAPEMLARATQMDSYLVSLASQGAFSGAALVAYQGHVLLSRGYGEINREEHRAAAAGSRFRLASVTKPLTALGVLHLVAQGKLDLAASACTYLSPCPAAWQPVTVAQLLNHTSGIVDYADFASFADVEQLPATPDQILARFSGFPLATVPGAVYDYSNSNYVLLALIIERVTGKPYADYMRDEIFTPLGMANTGVDPGDGSALGGTRGYAGGGPDILLNVSNLYGAGNLYSTVEDLNRLAEALDADTLIPPDLAAQMATPGNGRYGFGWMIEQRGAYRLVYHPGSMSGAATWFGRYPDVGLTVIVLSNNYWANVYAIADTLAASVLP